MRSSVSTRAGKAQEGTYTLEKRLTYIPTAQWVTPRFSF